MTENGFLPISRGDMKKQHIEQLDFVYVIGDAYVDHPSFGHAIISRVLQAHGFTVGIISQPDWKADESITVLGRPRLAFLVSSGNMDSMVNHYYVSKKRRKEDAYTPGGKAGKRPDHAAVVYSNLIRRSYKDVPIILGGIEASLRRLAHYDYWSDSYKRSILLDAGADLISYGMGEKSIVEIAEALDAGLAVKDITFVRGTVYRTQDISSVYDGVVLPAYEDCKVRKQLYAESFMRQYENTDPFQGKALIEPYPNKVFVVQNPPAGPLSMQEMDDIYDLPYMRAPHPSYEKQGGVPAMAEIKFSLISCRGCFGGCNFCALTFHQGRIVQVRSHESLLKEAEWMTRQPDFKGYIHDVGGPTANFRHPSCKKQLQTGVCKNKQCLFPEPCKNLDSSHEDYISLLKKLRALPGVKKVFIRSGVRFDYVLEEKGDRFLKEMIQYHVSGQCKVAPEHISDKVLNYMGKPKRQIYDRFVRKYEDYNKKLGLKQYLVPYLMSSHPGASLKEAVELAEYLRDTGHKPEQVQDFYPTPSTISTVMYYTGIDPRTGERVYVAKNPHEKAMQRALMQYKAPENYELVKEALFLAHREDLIGFDKKCLIPPRKMKCGGENGEAAGKKGAKAVRKGNSNTRKNRRL
ncbi:MAG: YgiQ family radical SAM protein [Lachnospiraceae bacterium]|nr:YgiQ family radical SAM protein [Lachnospiraceae bacterium]